MKNYNLKQSGAEVQELLDQVPVNKKEIERLKQLYAGLSKTNVEIVASLPSVGVANTIYRVTGSDGYADYMFDADDLSTAILLATYGNGIDEEPTAGSDNLVKSGGVLKDVGNSYLYLPNVDIWEENEVGCLHNDGNLYTSHTDFVTTDFLRLKKGDILVAGVGIVLPSNNVYRSLIIYDLDKQLLHPLLYDDETITYKATQDVLVRVSFYVNAPADELFLYYGKPSNITRERKERFPKVGNLIDLESPEAIKDHGIDDQGNIVYYKDMIVAPSIPVIEGNLYTVSMDIKRTVGIIYEDEKKNKTDFILITESPKLIEIPTGVKYVRLIGWSTLTGYVYFGPYYSEKSETAIANKQLSPYIPASAIEGADSRNMLMFNSPNNLMKYSLDFDGKISPWDAGYVSHPIPVKVGNMIPYYGATENKGITETGEIASYEGGIISKRFKIEGGKSYTFYADYFNTTQVVIRFEDDEGNKVGFELIQRKVMHTFTAPEDATYCIVPLKIHSYPQGYIGMSLSDTVDWCGLHEYVYYEGDKTAHAIRLEDEKHNILSAKLLSSSERTLSISPFAGCKYIRIGTPSQSAQFKEVGCYDLYPLRGKKIALYGDSITVDYYSAMYAAMMKYRTQALDVQRFGLSGGDYTAHLQQDTYLNRLLDYNPDVVIIHSVNSHRSNRPVGTMSSTEGASDDIGALKKIFRKIIEKNNKAKIYFCLPLCYGEVSLGDATWVGSTSPNSLGLYLSDYIKGYIDVCRNYGVEIINLTDRCGFKDLVESGNSREYTYDGVHPIWKGYNIMTGIIAEHINNMWNQRNG